jgi:hypothetical protein
MRPSSSSYCPIDASERGAIEQEPQQVDTVDIHTGTGKLVKGSHDAIATERCWEQKEGIDQCDQD